MTPTTPPSFADALQAYESAQTTVSNDQTNDAAADAKLKAAQDTKAATEAQIATDKPVAYAAGQMLIQVITEAIAPFAPAKPTA